MRWKERDEVYPMSAGSSLYADAIERKEQCHLPLLENSLTQLVLCLLVRCSRGVSVSDEESGNDELGSVVVSVVVVVEEKEEAVVSWVRVCCLLELLGFSSRISSASEGPRFSICDG
jgi:hypothetical protein